MRETTSTSHIRPKDPVGVTAADSAGSLVGRVISGWSTGIGGGDARLGLTYSAVMTSETCTAACQMRGKSGSMR
jgi:hypothetical protein